jgi:hypothetical protein
LLKCSRPLSWPKVALAFIQFAFLAFLLVYGLAASALIREHVHCGF